MKLLMIIVDGDKKEEVEVLLGRAGVSGYTELPNAVGKGTTGLKLGSRAFPKTSAVILTIVDDEALAELTKQVKAFCADCGERLKIVVWGVQEVV